MAKKLKLWNGRPYGVLPPNQWERTRIYVAAYSVEDARRGPIAARPFARWVVRLAVKIL